MSRIGKKPVPVPSGVTVSIDSQAVSVKGPKGELSRVLPGEVAIAQEGEEIVVTRRNDSRNARARHGLSRTLIANMVEGVSKGFEKRLAAIRKTYDEMSEIYQKSKGGDAEIPLK